MDGLALWMGLMSRVTVGLLAYRRNRTRAARLSVSLRGVQLAGGDVSVTIFTRNVATPAWSSTTNSFSLGQKRNWQLESNFDDASYLKGQTNSLFVWPHNLLAFQLPWCVFTKISRRLFRTVLARSERHCCTGQGCRLAGKPP